MPKDGMRAGEVGFDPRLPLSCRAGIGRLRMGVLDTVVPRFDDAVCPQAIITIGSAGGAPEPIPSFTNRLPVAGHPTILRLTVGAAASSGDRGGRRGGSRLSVATSR